MDRRLTDRELYPAIWIMLALLLGAFCIWKYALGAPTISGCAVWRSWHVYCPGCGGTRALSALLAGRPLLALYYNPAVPVTAAVTAVYLVSQTLLRLRGGRGWALRYSTRWPGLLAGLLLANCAVRNLLWLCFRIPL